VTGERWEPLELAAARLEFAAIKATPGPWWRPLHLSSKNMVLGEPPEDEKGTLHARTVNAVVIVLAQALAPTHRFIRKRSGRDLEYIATVHPDVGRGMADVLRTVALEMQEAAKNKDQTATEPESWGACLRLSNRILRTGDRKRHGE